ncbi:Allergen Asp f 7 [Grifola frondosa]|uniref:Allergen Asp f 7 n=1 Tax=Grifola frondosa TaxID=5627 RepID=A0A1C7MC70_GRIFR|nr:Allergen Asp f 7 [Grifola frondosa]
MFFNTFVSTIFAAAFLAGTTHATPIARSGFSGDATFFNPGLGACGANSVDSDHIVALSPSEFASGARCFQHIGVHANGQFVDATVVDLCLGCASGSIDLSPSAFGVLADLSVGRLHGVTWDFE